MARSLPPFRQADFAGGMVHRSVPTPVRGNECELLLNFDLDEFGCAKKRKGVERMGGKLGGPVQGIFEHRPRDGSQHLMVLAGGTLYRWVGNNWSEVGGGLAPTRLVRACFVPFGDLLIILNGVDLPRKYDSATGELELLGGDPPVASFGTVYYQHLFLSGVAGHPVRVWYSETADPEDGYDSKNYLVDLVVSDSSPVTAFLPLDQELLVGKRRSITAIRGMDPRDFRQPQNRAAYTNELGVVHHQAILDVGGRPWFLSDTGVYQIIAPFETPQESWCVHGHIERLDPTRIQRSFAVQLQQRGQAIFWVPRYSGPDMDLGLVAHPGRGRGERAAWALRSGPNLTAAAVGWSTIEGEVLYMGDGDGNVYREGQGYEDAGEPVVAVYRSGYEDLERPDELTVLRTVGIEAEVGEATTVTVTASTDRGRLRTEAAVSLAGPSYDEEGRDVSDPHSMRQVRRGDFQVAQPGLLHQIEVKHEESSELRLRAVELRGYSRGVSRGRNR